MPDNLPDRRLYSVLLLAYPRDFRVRFGAEMVDTFSQDMHWQRDQHGSRGALSAWCSVFWEILSVAGPLRLRSSMTVTLLLSLFASTAFVLAFFAAVTPHCTR